MRVGIYGLGYVGTVTAVCLAERGHDVVGVDIDPGKVEALAGGHSPVLEPGVDALLQEAVAAGRIRARTELAEALAATDVSVVTVGTPSRPDGRIDLAYVDRVCEQLASELLGSPRQQHVVILRSTILPGSTRDMVDRYFRPLMDEGRCEVLFVPEFLREGSAVEDFRSPSTYVVGSESGQAPARKEILTLFADQAPDLLQWHEAETIKYASNAFHAVKVAFANEIGRLAEPLSMDARRVMSVLCADTKLNISPYYLKPGNPFGGSCLPKDLSALNALAARHHVELPLMKAIQASNRVHQERLASMVMEDPGDAVCILGLSFKPSTDDLRNSPMVALAETLVGKGYQVRIFDPCLDPERLVGANRSAAIQALPHLGKLLSPDLASAVGTSGTVVASQACVPAAELSSLLTPDHRVIDVNGWPELQQVVSRYRGLCW